MNKIPELKQIIGAMIFASKRPLTIKEIRRCVVEVAEEHGEAHNSTHMVTISETHRDGYTVAPNKFDTFNIQKR